MKFSGDSGTPCILQKCLKCLISLNIHFLNIWCLIGENLGDIIINYLLSFILKVVKITNNNSDSVDISSLIGSWPLRGCENEAVKSNIRQKYINLFKDSAMPVDFTLFYLLRPFKIGYGEKGQFSTLPFIPAMSTFI